MSAPKRTKGQNIRQTLWEHIGINCELRRLEKAANTQIRKALPKSTYEPKELAKLFLSDLEEIVSVKDWRPALERNADNLRRAAKRIRDAVRLLVQAANSCPTYSTIPSIVWESTPEAEFEQQWIAALPVEDRLFTWIKSKVKREGRTVVDLRTIAPDFLQAMLVYAVRCEREAERLTGILKARNRHFDRLGPVLNLMKDVQSFTGRTKDDTIARLLADAYEVSGSGKQFSAAAISKIRQRHLAS